jgi:hypothetical protein
LISNLAACLKRQRVLLVEQTGWYAQVHVKNARKSYHQGAARQPGPAGEIKQDIENQIRGLLKSLGLVIGRAKMMVHALKSGSRIGRRLLVWTLAALATLLGIPCGVRLDQKSPARIGPMGLISSVSSRRGVDQIQALLLCARRADRGGGSRLRGLGGCQPGLLLRLQRGSSDADVLADAVHLRVELPQQAQHEIVGFIGASPPKGCLLPVDLIPRSNEAALEDPVAQF